MSVWRRTTVAVAAAAALTGTAPRPVPAQSALPAALHQWIASGGGLPATGSPPGPDDRALPASALALGDADGGRSPWWTSASAPTDWRTRPATLAAAMRWQPGDAPGVEWGELTLRGSGEAWRTRIVAVRLDPRRVALRLDTAFTTRGRPDWTLDRVPRDAAVAVNAGQFVASMPWGWVALDGRTYLQPQSGPLASAVVIDSSGSVRWVRGPEVGAAARHGGTRWAFQSYPTLLDGGLVPRPLQAPGRGVDVEHRDARAAIGLDEAGRVTIALTRFDAAGNSLGFVPLGLTAPEMAAVMGALGCRDAVMLDGGISAQLHLRTPDGPRRYTGLRAVPLALVAVPRQYFAR